MTKVLSPTEVDFAYKRMEWMFGIASKVFVGLILVAFVQAVLFQLPAFSTLSKIDELAQTLDAVDAIDSNEELRRSWIQTVCYQAKESPGVSMRLMAQFEFGGNLTSSGLDSADSLFVRIFSQIPKEQLQNGYDIGLLQIEANDRLRIDVQDIYEHRYHNADGELQIELAQDAPLDVLQNTLRYQYLINYARPFDPISGHSIETIVSRLVNYALGICIPDHSFQVNVRAATEAEAKRVPREGDQYVCEIRNGTDLAATLHVFRNREQIASARLLDICRIKGLSVPLTLFAELEEYASIDPRTDSLNAASSKIRAALTNTSLSGMILHSLYSRRSNTATMLVSIVLLFQSVFLLVVAQLREALQRAQRCRSLMVIEPCFKMGLGVVDFLGILLCACVLPVLTISLIINIGMPWSASSELGPILITASILIASITGAVVGDAVQALWQTYWKGG